MFSIGTPLSESSETKLCRISRGGPLLLVQPCLLENLAEGATDVVGIQLGTDRRGEDKVVIFPARAGSLPGDDLTLTVANERIDTAFRQGQRST
ncbi:hypothetical protein [Microtetraspora fusca]|uniref:hypothetical protein n=1 Tax=Microtetraspora fusca TaxID=1997 RepID=UPI00082A4DAA|nr:hypothetical protein [Microtetraspora fusca]